MKEKTAEVQGKLAQLSQLGGKVVILKIFSPHNVSLSPKTLSNLT